MEIYELQYFLKAAEYEHFTKAAEELYITQPTVTMAIGRLEKELGVKLFAKSGYRVSLTTEGACFAEYAKRIVAETEAMKAEVDYMRAGMSGSVTVGSVLPVKSLGWLREIMDGFAAGRPDVGLTVYTEEQEILLKRVSEGRIDYALVTRAVTEGGYRWEPLYTQRLGVMMRRDDKLAEKTEVDISELKLRKFYCNNSDMDIHSLLTDESGFLPEIVFEGASPGYIGEKVAMGEGVSILAVDEFELHAARKNAPEYDSMLTIRPLRGGRFFREIGLLSWESRRLLPAARAFGELIREKFPGKGE